MNFGMNSDSSKCLSRLSSSLNPDNCFFSFFSIAFDIVVVLSLKAYLPILDRVRWILEALSSHFPILQIFL